MAKPIDIAIDVLNEFFEADPSACQKLLETRVPTSELISKHATIQVAGAQAPYSIGPLGLINGIVEAITGERLAMIVDNDKCAGFTRYKPKQPAVTPATP